METFENQNLGHFAQAAIAQYWKQTCHYEKAVLADRDTENLHQMRVGMRRLRTALEVFALGVEMPPAGQASAVGKVARHLGRLRDLDVIAATLGQPQQPPLSAIEQAALGEVLDQLKRDRHRRFKRVKHLLKGRHYRHLKQGLTAWIDQPVYGAIASLPILGTIPDLILPLVSRLWLHPGWLVGTRPSPEGPQVTTGLERAAIEALLAEHSDTLHSLRKHLKGVRYQLKLVAPLYGQVLERDMEHLAQMQDTLGHLQDSLVMADFLESRVTAARDRLPTLFRQLQASRQQDWETWQQHQGHYLQAATRQRLRRILIQPTISGSEGIREASQSPHSIRDNSGEQPSSTPKGHPPRRSPTAPDPQ